MRTINSSVHLYSLVYTYLSLSAGKRTTVKASSTIAAGPGWLSSRKSLAFFTVLSTLSIRLKSNLSRKKPQIQSQMKNLKQ